MAAIVCLGFVDTSRATAAYVLKHKEALLESMNPRHKGVRYLELVRDGEEDVLLETWKTMRSLLHKVKTALVSGPRKGVLANAQVVALDPRGAMAWEVEDVPEPDNFLRVQLCLLPSPNAFIFAEADKVVLNVGVPTIVDHRGYVSELNLDHAHAVHKLIMEVVFEPVVDMGADRPAS